MIILVSPVYVHVAVPARNTRAVTQYIIRAFINRSQSQDELYTYSVMLYFLLIMSHKR